MVPSANYCSVHFPHVTLQPIGFILWPLGPFVPLFTCNNFIVWFFEATGHIRLYWRNLVNTDSIFGLLSYRDTSWHRLWKAFFFFLLDIEQLSKSIILLSYKYSCVSFYFFVLVFFVIYSAGQIRIHKCSGGKQLHVKKFPSRKNFFLVMPPPLSARRCIFSPLKSPHIPAIIYPEDYCPCLLVIKSCDKMNTPIKWIKSPIVSSPSLRVGPLYYHVYAAPSSCKLRWAKKRGTQPIKHAALPRPECLWE